ncbi:MAG: hypothetical protein LBU77_05425 [Clostridiales bacterium]|nr:hypothetical protein [Clostridiales bacterium]
MDYDKKDLLKALQAFVIRIAQKENATPAELEAMAKVADVVFVRELSF